MLTGGRATGIGSLPGEDIDRAVAWVADHLPDLPHLPELPARGAHAAMIGRTAGSLAGLAVDLQPSGWRFVARPGLDQRRAQDTLAGDLDALVPVFGTWRGPVKVQLVGPWTLAASVERTRGGPILGDRGAIRDIVASLAETARAHVLELTRRLPGAEPILQLDEPSLPAVLGGRIRTHSGVSTIAAVSETDAHDALRAVIAGAGVPVVVHCCAPMPPVALLRSAGAEAVSIDLTPGMASGRRDEAIGELVEGGGSLVAGVVPSLRPAGALTAKAVAGPLRARWRALGLPADALAGSVLVTPTCGLAGADPEWAMQAMDLAREAATLLAEAPDLVGER